MKSILCFGDSLTWGYVPDAGTRLSFATRWPGIVQNILGSDYRVIEEALNGRTTVFEDPFKPQRKAIAYLPMLLESHAPIDHIILMLGTNDLQMHRHANAKMAARGCASCITAIQNSTAVNLGHAPQILLLAPPPIRQLHGLMQLMWEDQSLESQKLALHYKQIADAFGVDFFDTGQVIEASAIDGVHLDENAHRTLGQRIANIIKSKE